MKRVKTVIAILLTFAMILTGGSSLSLLDANAESGSSAAEKQVAENSDMAEEQAEGESQGQDETDAVTQREIKADLLIEPLFEELEDEDSEEEIMTEAYKSLRKFWKALASRDAVVSDKETGLKVKVSGELPEGVTAEARYIRAGNTNPFAEQGIITFSLTLFDEEGNVYVPEGPVTVTVEGKAVENQIGDENGLIVYSYETAPERAEQFKEEYEKPFYTADVKVFRSEQTDKDLLQYEAYDKNKEYEDGEDAVRFFNDRDGLAIGEDQDSVIFEYDFNNSFGEGAERYAAGEDGGDVAADSAVFVLTTQMKERTLKASAGEAEITVTGPLDKDVTLDADEITKKDKSYKGFVKAAAEELDKDTDEVTKARAFDIDLIDKKTGKAFKPDAKVKVSIDLGDKKAVKDSKLDILQMGSDSEEKAEVVDADIKDDTIEFETKSLPVYVVTQTEKETILTAKDGRKYRITVSYDSSAGIPEDAELSARELSGKEYNDYYRQAEEAIDSDGLSYARIFDISIVGKDGKKYQPDEDVSVRIELMDKDAEEDLKVVHFGKKTEILDSDTVEDNISFRTGSFSIFAVVGDDGKLYDEDDNPVYIRTYRFYTLTSTGDYIEYVVPGEQGTTSSRQMIKNGEKPVAPLIPTDPMEKGGVFLGWYEGTEDGGDVVLEDNPYDFNNIPAITADEEIHLYAKFSRTLRVNFHEQYDSRSEDFPVAVSRNVEVTSEEGSGHGSGTINISEVTTKYYDSNNSGTPDMEFAGWSYTSIQTPGSPVDDDGNPVSIIQDDEITVTEDTDLYPVFKGIKWLSFYSGPAGSGATYYSPRSFSEGNEFTSLAGFIPDRAGYDFLGWWTGTPDSSLEEGVAYNVQITEADGSLIAGASDTGAGIAVSGGKLTITGSGATVYAKWERNPDKPLPPEPEIWYLVKIDPNGGALYTYDASEQTLSGTGSTWFWIEEGGDPIEEYTNVTRDYVPSSSGDYYYVNQNREYYGYPDTYVDGESSERKTYYTKKISEATGFDTYKYSPGTYRYAGWYEVDKDTGLETLYDFGKRVDHDTTLKLHWKKAGQYYIEYDPVMNRDGMTVEGDMDEGEDDTNGYADKASVQLTRRAIAPDGYEFIGWTVRGDNSGRVYRTDETIELPAEYAVTVNNKSEVFFEAVYTKVSSAKMIFDANGGILDEGVTPDFQYVETDYIEKPVFSIGTDRKTVQADRMINNGIYTLSGTQFFTREGCEFAGWNTEADGSGKHYDAGATYGVDSNEPVKLYAEWKVKVYFDKNEDNATWDESSWGTPNTDGYIDADGRQYYADDDRYYILVNVDAPLSEPLIKPAQEGSNLKFWSTSSEPDAEAFEFGETKITEETVLYAHWTDSALVPLHVFTYDPSDSDADATDRDSWRKTSKAEIASGTSKTVSDICSEYLHIPDEYAEGYEYVYAYVGTEIDKTKPADNDPVTDISADAEGKITVTYQGGSTAELESGQALYLVYAPKNTEETVNINYVKESGGGALQNVEGAVPGTITYNSGEMTLNESFVPEILNNATVSQSQTLKVTTKELVISQESTRNFNMPSRLDDGTKQLELIYSRIGTGDSGADSLDSLDSDAGKKLHLQIRDGKLQWSYDGDTWETFSGEDGFTPTIYAVYRERGHELKITKKVTADTGMRDYKKFIVTITSSAITEDSYSVEGTGYNTVEATPAHGDTPGSIELPVKHGSEVVISGLAEGAYTIAETDNENYVLKARTGPMNGDLTETGVTNNTTLDVMTLDKDMEAELSNDPQYICRIEYPENSGTYEKFFTLNSALEWANDPGKLDGVATIEMLVDYVMPAKDALFIDSGNEIQITTADSGAFEGEGPYAVITRDSDFTKGPMFDNEGALTFKGIVLDGKNAEVTSEMVHSAAEIIDDSGEEVKHGLYIEGNATFRNANNTGNGGAIRVSKGELFISGGSFENNSAAKGGAVYVSEGNIEISGGNIGLSGKGNSADEGGAIYYAGGGTITVSGGTISHNAAENGNGGGIYAANGTINISKGTISNNTAANGNGGAIFIDSAIIDIRGSQTSISSNTAKSGGAIYFDQSGTLTMAGGQIRDNTATDGDGGAVRMSEGTADFTGGTITGNSATNGNGGAVYADSAIVTVSNGTFSSNTAANGSAVFIDNGTGRFTGGSITGNISTQGGAVGVGSSSAKLEFSGSPQIKNNPIGTSGSNKYANVYLDQDTDSVISNTGTLGNNAYIGIYVPGSFEADLFKNRGEAGSLFGTFTPTYTDKATIAAFKNDRLDSVSAIALANSRNMMWGKAISVEVRYMASFTNNFLPDTVNSSSRFSKNDYYLPSGENSVSTVAEDLRSNYNINLPTNTAMFAGAYLEGDQNYVDYYKYITDVDWDNGTEDLAGSSGWKAVRRYKVDGEFKKDDITKLVIYYSEPAYISIENNTDYELDITSLTVYGHSAINGTAANDAGYGYVYAVNGAIRDELLPITADDLKLDKMKSIKLVFPGACGKTYQMTGSYKNVPGGTDIPVRIGGTSYGSVPQDKYSSFTLGTSEDLDIGSTPNLPTASGGSVDIAFGGVKPICKIETQEVTPAATDRIAAQTPPDSSGKVQYCFATLNDAKTFAVNHTLKTTAIEMLVDYLIPSTDVLAIPAGYDITLKTALGSGEGYYYEGDRATISRDADNMESFITSTGGAGTAFRIENLKFDGKSLGGNINGGVVKTSQCVVTIDDAEFVNCIANNGGGIFIERGNRNDVNLSVSNTTFDNCRSKSDASRQGGGAIWTDVRRNTTVADEDKQGFYLYKCQFRNCSAYDQGGAVFHRVDSDLDTITTIDSCQFIGCEAHAAGGMESGAKVVNLIDTTFRDCTATERNGGGANFYSLNSANPSATCTVNATGCTFINCRSTNLASGDRYGGGFRSTARNTYLTDCTFTNCSAKRGGGIAMSSSNAANAGIHGCVVDGCTATEYGGGVYLTVRTVEIDNVVSDTKTRQTEIKNCTAGTYGGGIRHIRNDANASLTVDHATISGNTSNGSGTNGNGGGISVKDIRNVTITDSTLQKNTAKSGGGGIYMGSSANDRRLTLDNTDVKENRSGDKGGGVYCDSQLTIRNGTMITKNAISTAADNAAGVYLLDGRTLTVGAENGGTDSSSIINNATDGKTASDIRLWSATTGDRLNNAASVYVYCNLSGRIGVVNASTKGTQFGSSAISDPKGFGYSEGTQVFRSDDETLFGVIDRGDPNGKKIIWRGDVICKITDEAGHLLYLGDDDPAVFDALDVGTVGNTSKSSAFSYLRNASPALYYKDGTPYTGDAYCVKMLESYVATKPIYTYVNRARTITLTTAGRTDAEYPYRGRAGTPATITRSASMENKAMITAGCTFKLQNITLDGGSRTGVAKNTATRILQTADKEVVARVTIGNKATLQNAHVNGNGGAVFTTWAGNEVILDGGEIKNCTATNGGGIYKEGRSIVSIISGNITACVATNNGGGVYYEYKNESYNSHIFIMEGGSITKCSAVKGGGVFVANQVIMRMSGGNIRNNTATGEGGGIAMGGNAVRLHFSGRVVITGNKLNGEECNVHLAYGTTSIINTSGLDKRANIGVYVPGGSLYENYGVAGKPFGKYTGSANLQRFTNDRNGCKGGIKPEDPGTIYWIEGSRKVILRKINSSYDSLSGAEFTVYFDTDGNVASDMEGNRLDGLKSNDSGMFFAGEMYYGTYYIEETRAPAGYTRPDEGKFFVVTVTANGVGYYHGDEYLKEFDAE